MLRRAYCLLGEGGKDLTIPCPNLRRDSGLRAGAGLSTAAFSLEEATASPSLPCRPVLCSGQSPSSGSPRGIFPLSPVARGWHAACQRVPDRYGFRNSSIAFSRLPAAQPQLKHLSNLADTGLKLHPAYSHGILNQQLMRMLSGPWFWEETVLISGKLVKKLRSGQE